MRIHTPFPILAVTFLVLAIGLPVHASQSVAGDTGFFLIESNPSGAPVIFDGLFIGVTPVTYPVVSSGAPQHTITVSANGYYPHTAQYTANPKPGERIKVFAELEPSQSTGTLTVTSSPGGALVTLDSGKGQQAPWTYKDIQSGGHLVQAFLSGYSPSVSIVNIPPGGSITVDLVLKPLSEVGTIQVKSSPGGADVYVDGIYKGSTATTVGNLAAGTHFALLKKVGYEDWPGLVTIRPNQVVVLDTPLELQKEMTTGFINVDSTPAGASVLVDGIFQGITQAGNPLDLTGISPGEHSITLKLQNYQDYVTRVPVQAGKTASVRATLSPMQTPAGSGTVQISSEPSGANIFIDNSCVGITPLTIPSLPEGPHTIVLRLYGYQDYSSSFNLSAGQTAQVQVGLTPSMAFVPFPVWACVAAFIAAGFFMVARRAEKE